MPNLKVILTVTAFLALIGMGWALYQKGSDHAQAEARIEQLTLQLDTLETVMVVQDAALKSHSARAAEDAKNNRLLNERIKTLNAYVEDLEDRDSVCLSGPDVDRLRDLWGPA